MNLQRFVYTTGIAVCDVDREKDGDYLMVAFIDRERKIKFYERLSLESTAQVEKFATSNPAISTSQPEKKVFNN